MGQGTNSQIVGINTAQAVVVNPSIDSGGASLRSNARPHPHDTTRSVIYPPSPPVLASTPLPADILEFSRNNDFEKFSTVAFGIDHGIPDLHYSQDEYTSALEARHKQRMDQLHEDHVNGDWFSKETCKCAQIGSPQEHR